MLSVANRPVVSTKVTQPPQTPQPHQHQQQESQKGQRGRPRRQKTPKMDVIDTTTLTISDPPTPLDRALQNLPCYDVNNDRERDYALEYLETILARWVLSLHTTSPKTSDNNKSKNNHRNPSSSSSSCSGGQVSNPWQKPRVSLVTFGSYRLGVHRNSSDIDVLAVAPPCCTRHDFFTSFVDLLKKDPFAEEVHPIPGAYTPVIKFRIKGFQIDMLFARVADVSKLVEFQRQRANPLVSKPQLQLPRLEYMISDSDLIGHDEAGLRSMNGARVSQILLQVVPNLDNYRSVLKAVKEWAMQAGIYSNVLGFWGGINWAILVAWICMRHPKTENSVLLEIFFRQFATWKWPKPVLLTPIQDTPPPGVLPMPAWNPSVNPRDGLHICPIITPAYPSMNSSYNVGLPQLRRIQDEMVHACNLIAEHNGELDTLFEPSDFFNRHEHYLQVTIRARSRQDFLEWFRFVESRLRLLISSVETQQVHAWPFARFFDLQYDADGTYLGQGRSNDENAVHDSLFFIALRFAPGLQAINLCHLTSDFMFTVNAWERRRVGMELFLSHVTRAELPAFVFAPAEADCNSDKKPTKMASSSASVASTASASSTSSCEKEPKVERNHNDQNVPPKVVKAVLSTSSSSSIKKYRRNE